MVLQAVAAFIDQEGLAGDLIRAIRQGLYFGVETRIPYALTGLVRPYLFNKAPRPLFKSIKFYAEQGLKHGWVIARISFLFKLVERALMILQGVKEPEQWHSFVAGCAAGYNFMVRDPADASLKRQINMAIGIRTLYSFCSYLMRHGLAPGLPHSAEGYARGHMLWSTLMWGVVMWHWRHQTIPAPGEMDKGQVNQMNFIYKNGDTQGAQGWFSGNYLAWLLVLLAIRFGTPEDLPSTSWFGRAKSSLNRSMSKDALNFTMLYDQFSDSEAMMDAGIEF